MKFLAAAEEGGAPFNPLSPETGLYVWTTIAFLVVLYFLAKKVFPKLEEGLADREQKVRSDLEQAEAAKKQAEELVEQHRAMIAEARSEAQKIADEVRQSAEATRKQILQQAEQETTQMTARSVQEIEAARQQMVSELKADIGQMAVQIASKIVEKELDPRVHEDLVEAFIRDLTSQQRSNA